MTIEQLLKEPNQELALTKAIAMIVIMENALRFYANEIEFETFEEKRVALEALEEIEDME